MNSHFSQWVSRLRGLRVPAFRLLLAATVPIAANAPAMAAPGHGKAGAGADTDFQAERRILWRLPLAASYSQVRPAVGPDGAVYAVDALGSLYIVPPDPIIAEDGSVSAAVVADAGSKGVAVGPDGTIYTGDENAIRAFHADGTEKWSYIQAPRAFILSAVAVGPEGKVYAIASSGMGVFALADRGEHAELLWQSPERYDRSNATYTEIAFGPGSDGDQLYFRANQNTRGLKLGDGTEVFALALGLDAPVVSPYDGSWHRSDAAYDPDGNLLWRSTDIPPATAATVPALGADGTHYTVNQGLRVLAIDPFGRLRWSAELNERVGAPDVDPANSQIIVPTTVDSTSPAALRAVDAQTGNDLWRLELPLSATPAVGLQYVDTPLAFNPDGSTAYVITGVAGGTATLYALSLDPAIPDASTLLRSSAVNLSARARRGTVKISGAVTVTDENRAPIRGATVSATWTTSSGLIQSGTAVTGANGVAKFAISGPGGSYTLTVDSIAKEPYTYDPDHSVLSGSLYF